MKGSKRRFLILDANVLIDFIKSDGTIIKLICKYVGDIYLATPIVDEVNEVDMKECTELGIKLVEPDLSEAMLAMQNVGALSFQDNLCLILAKNNDWTCVTNDKPLRQKCEDEGVPLIWGIELVCILVEAGGLPAEDARLLILEIQKNNPKYITQTIVNKAFERLEHC